MLKLLKAGDGIVPSKVNEPGHHVGGIVKSVPFHSIAKAKRTLVILRDPGDLAHHSTLLTIERGYVLGVTVLMVGHFC